MAAPRLSWLPEATEFQAQLKRLQAEPRPDWAELVALARLRLDFLKTERLDQLLMQHFADGPPAGLSTRPVRLAVLASSTTVHLLPAIRVAALRRNLWVSVYEADYGQYMQELNEPNSDLHRFRPDVVLLAFDARHLTAGLDPAADRATADSFTQEVLSRLRRGWTLARDLGASVIQQTILPTIPRLMGDNEQRLPGSAAAMVDRLNAGLRAAAEADALVQLLTLDTHAARDGIDAWHDPTLWHRAKQDITPVAAPVYGDLVGRILAALQGRSAKCLVLDLDNTLWGGVIGDDGLEGIVLGQGSALGEAHLSVQAYAKALATRGVILAVCSKNDEDNALAAFDRHPEMLLRRSDIACFVANWSDKATNLRHIATTLNIGIDSLVFLDDNPFERNLVRAELPDVAVPEVLDDDPAFMAQTLADAGYFDVVSLTDEDRARSGSYQANAQRAALAEQASDLPTYLRSLQMRLVWRPFDRIGLSRIVQLINKTNQFNLTTRRMNETEVAAVIDDPQAFGLQVRLIDRFGDNGVIAIVIGRMDLAQPGLCRIDTWLMSCRVLGRGVEAATLDLVVQQARSLGATTLLGEFRPTAKNAMVADHYAKLGFDGQEPTEEGGHRSVLTLADYIPAPVFMDIEPAV